MVEPEAWDGRSRSVIQGNTYLEQWKVRRLVARKDQDRSLFLLVPMGKPVVAEPRPVGSRPRSSQVTQTGAECGHRKKPGHTQARLGPNGSSILRFVCGGTVDVR